MRVYQLSEWSSHTLFAIILLTLNSSIIYCAEWLVASIHLSCLHMAVQSWAGGGRKINFVFYTNIGFTLHIGLWKQDCSMENSWRWANAQHCRFRDYFIMLQQQTILKLKAITSQVYHFEQRKEGKILYFKSSISTHLPPGRSDPQSILHLPAPPLSQTQLWGDLKINKINKIMNKVNKFRFDRRNFPSLGLC